jgi:hypothetical protein
VIFIFLFCILIENTGSTGQIIDEQSNALPPNTLPPPRETDRGPDEWTPYNSRLEFETADFIYRRNQMSGGDIDTLFNLWADTLDIHGDTPPFANHSDLYSTIDSTPLGDIPWQSFSSTYSGEMPEDEVPSWMTTEYEVWFRDPRELVRNLLANSDFKDNFDYAPMQEYDSAGNHRFHNFMSGNWAWKQAVSFYFHFCLLIL